MAPEVLMWGKSSFDSDIFSLHVVIWEVRAAAGMGLVRRSRFQVVLSVRRECRNLCQIDL